MFIERARGALPLYGGGAWDAAACVAGLTVPSGVGDLRLIAGVMGFFSGYARPRLLYYWKRPLGEVVSRDDVKAAIVLGGGPVPLGAQVVGIF